MVGCTRAGGFAIVFGLLLSCEFLVAPAFADTCYTTWDDGNEESRIIQISIESGATDTVVRTTGLSTGNASGLVVDGETATVCVDGAIVRVSLADGETASEASSCVAIGPADSGLMIRSSDASAPVHQSEADSGGAAAIPAFVEASRFAESGGLLYAAWHHASIIDVYDATTGTLADAIALEAFDDWVWGMDVVAGTMYVLGGGRHGAGVAHVAAFDVSTGDAIVDITVDAGAPGLVRGLACGP